jgi:putative transposase
MTRRGKRHNPEQIVRKLRDADAMLNAGEDLASVLQALEVSQSTFDRWRNQYGGMKAEEALHGIAIHRPQPKARSVSKRVPFGELL